MKNLRETTTRLACMVATAAAVAVVPAQPASAALLVPCDWHGYSVSQDTSGELTALSQFAYPLRCEFWQYRNGVRTYVGFREVSGAPAIMAETVGFKGAYQTEVCTFESGAARGCHYVWP